MKSHAIAVSLSLVLTGVFATPPGASAQFDLDLQATEIGNQLQEILNRITRYTTLLSQFTRLDCSARSEIPTGSSFKHRRICSIPPRLFQTGATYCKPRTPSPQADIRNVYPDGAGDAAVATFERRGNYADRSVVLAHAQADATAALTDTLDAADGRCYGS